MKNVMIKRAEFFLPVCILSIGVLTAAMLTGCGSGRTVQTEKEPVLITVWNYYNGSQKDEFDTLVQQFNETAGRDENVVVDAVSKGTVGELIQAVLESADKKAGSPVLPQLCAAYADTAYELDRKGLLADMSPYLTEDEWSEYVDAYLDEGRFGAGEGIKVFPIAKSTELLTVNMTAWEPFAEATGSALEELETWEGIAEVARRFYEYTDALTPEEGDGMAFFGRDAFANYMLVGSRQLGQDIFLVADDGMTIQLDKRTMRRLWDNYYVPYVHGYYTAEGKFRSDDLKMGNLIAYVGSTSGAPYTPEKVVFEDGSSETIVCQVLPLPDFEDTDPCAVQQGAGMVLFAGEPEQEQAAMTFLKWFTESETNLEFSVESGYLPVKKEANSEVFLNQIVEKNRLEFSDVLMETLVIGMESVNSGNLYTTRPFENGTAAREILNTTMPEYARRNREAVVELIRQGMPAGEAAGQYDTDEQFEQWYRETREKLIACSEQDRS